MEIQEMTRKFGFGEDTEDGIQFLDGLEAVRYRPELYIGIPSPETLVACVLKPILQEKPEKVYLSLWAKGAITLSWTNNALSIEPGTVPVGDPTHPEVYRLFMNLFVPEPYGYAVLNALSERLTVHIGRAGIFYRTTFARGGLTSLLSKTRPRELLGVCWLTFKPDSSLVPGDLSLEKAVELAIRFSDPKATVVTVVDRRKESAAW